MGNSEEKLIDAWIELHHSKENISGNDENFWAYEELDNLCENEPLQCLEIIRKMSLKSEDDWILVNVAAGPLEDLLVRHGDMIIDELENIAKKDIKIQKMLASVWKNNIKDDIWDRLGKYRVMTTGY